MQHQLSLNGLAIGHGPGAQGTRRLARIAGTALRAAGAALQRARTDAEQRHRARAVRRALRDLDDRTLHDLGFHRSEIGSIAAEVAGSVDPSRVRAFV